MALAQVKLPVILFGAAQLLKVAIRRNAAFRARVKEHNLVAQIMTRDEEIGRWYAFDNGKVTTGAGLHKKPDIKLMFKNAAVGVSLLTPPINWLDQINAQKDFVLTVEGPDALTNWFAQTLMMAQSAGLKYGTKMRDGTMRYCNMTNGGPVFVDVKNGKIVRMTPIDLTENDGASWTIEAKGQKLTPPRKTTLAPHGQNAKSIVYSPDRLLYPMKRVDFIRTARAIRKTAASPATCASPGTRRSRSSPTRSSGKSASMARVRSRSHTARITPGAMSATTCRRCSGSPMRSA
jgi:trimethylamine-N-oxide reductase (cytochrome c)